MRKSLNHYIENTGRTDLVFMEIFKADPSRGVIAIRLAGAHTSFHGRRDPQSRSRGHCEISRNRRGRDAGLQGILYRPGLAWRKERLGAYSG